MGRGEGEVVALWGSRSVFAFKKINIRRFSENYIIIMLCQNHTGVFVMLMLMHLLFFCITMSRLYIVNRHLLLVEAQTQIFLSVV